MAAKVFLTPQGRIVFTREYRVGTTGTRITRGTSAIILAIHTGWFGGVRRLTVRLQDGSSVSQVPIEYFRS